MRLTTLSEHYGVAEGENIDDVTGMADSARRGWVAFHKDPSVRRNVAEKQAVLEHGARLFCVPNGQVTASTAAGRYLSNLPAIVRACEQPGPFIYGVYPDRIEKLKL